MAAHHRDVALEACKLMKGFLPWCNLALGLHYETSGRCIRFSG